MNEMMALLQHTEGGNQSFMLLFYIIVILYGAYSVYSGNKMKRTQRPMQWLLNNEERKHMRRPEEFCCFMAPRTKVFGVLCMVSGAIGVFMELFRKIPHVLWIVPAAFIGCIIWFFVILKKAKKKYR